MFGFLKHKRSALSILTAIALVVCSLGSTEAIAAQVTQTRKISFTVHPTHKQSVEVGKKAKITKGGGDGIELVDGFLVCRSAKNKNQLHPAGSIVTVTVECSK